MRLDWTDEALDDRRSIMEYIAADNVAAALSTDEKFSRAALNIAQRPGLGRPGRWPGTREFTVMPSYILVYDTTQNSVRILRVMHTRRHWPPEVLT